MVKVMCNNGDIIAQSVKVEGENYTSQLAIAFSQDLIGKTVQCSKDDGLTTHIISSFIIEGKQGNPLFVIKTLIVHKLLCR